VKLDRCSGGNAFIGVCTPVMKLNNCMVCDELEAIAAAASWRIFFF
jgi:hypothetical protein